MLCLSYFSALSIGFDAWTLMEMVYYLCMSLSIFMKNSAKKWKVWPLSPYRMRIAFVRCWILSNHNVKVFLITFKVVRHKHMNIYQNRLFFLTGKITLHDLKKCKQANLFLDTFLNLDKYLDHEQKEPFSTVRVST